MNMITTLKASAAIVVFALAGCATQSELEATRAIAEKAQQDAISAKGGADAAMAAAHEANAAAIAAHTVADQARQEAQASQACCNENKESIERAFRQSVSK